jgi:hypothetical protein
MNKTELEISKMTMPHQYTSMEERLRTYTVSGKGKHRLDSAMAAKRAQIFPQAPAPVAVEEAPKGGKSRARVTSKPKTDKPASKKVRVSKRASRLDVPAVQD